jgi:hypothetical protein
MEIVLLPVLILAGIALVKGVAWWVEPRSYARWALRRAKHTPIAGLKDGQRAKISGVVSAIAPTVASPIGGRACVGFRVEVKRLDRQVMPVVMERETCGVFSVSDDTGKVDVEGPLFLGLDFEQGWVIVPPDRRPYLEAAGVRTTGVFFSRRFAFREALIRPGDRVSVLGLATFEPDPGEPAAGFRSPAFRAHLVGSKAEPVIVADAQAAASR